MRNTIYPIRSLLIVTCYLLITAALCAGENDFTALLQKLGNEDQNNQRLLVSKYSNNEQEFRETYTLTADIRLFNLRLARMTLGNVVISNRDSFSIAYDPPFEKWDTQYLIYWQDDSTFADEVIGENREIFVYSKTNDNWHIQSYVADDPREAKQAIYHNGLASEAMNLIEFTSTLFQRRLKDIKEVLFLAEVYPIQLKKSAQQPDNYTAYTLNWDVNEGEERVRLHGVHLIGLETADHFIPLGGILKVSFVGLLDVDLIGVIRTK